MRGARSPRIARKTNDLTCLHLVPGGNGCPAQVAILALQTIGMFEQNKNAVLRILPSLEDRPPTRGSDRAADRHRYIHPWMCLVRSIGICSSARLATRHIPRLVERPVPRPGRTRF